MNGPRNSETPTTWLIAGLGNPGERYAGTRHDLGFALMDRLAERAGLKFERSGESDIAGPWPPEGTTDGRQVRAFIVKPMAYMNRSGRPLARLLLEWNIDPAHVLVACDDVNLPLGTIRLRAKGSSGGHNGLKSIAQELGTDFPRLRMGVGSAQADEDLAGFVLDSFDSEERDRVVEMLERAEQVTLGVLREGLKPSTSVAPTED